ncbi:MAG: thiamine-phosphate kinase [Alphaproteobacteria bacterium]
MKNEFDFINTFCTPLAAGYAGAFDLTDDAAFLSGDFVVSTDTLIAGVHFFETDAPHLIAQKALRVNLSDMAAMGATPQFYNLALSLPAEQNGLYNKAWMGNFFAGLKTDQDAFGLTLIGGDTTVTPAALTITVTMFGAVEKKEKMLRRNAAQTGDLIYVSGTIGDAALGLQILHDKKEASTATEDALITAYHLPTPFVDLGRSLVGIAHAAIDISDGFVADLTHICKTSRVGATVEAAKIPLSNAAREVLNAGETSVEALLTGGDDYVLLVTIPPEKSVAAEAQAAQLGQTLTEIGVINQAEEVVIHNKGCKMNFEKTGYQHF